MVIPPPYNYLKLLSIVIPLAIRDHYMDIGVQYQCFPV